MPAKVQLIFFVLSIFYISLAFAESSHDDLDIDITKTSIEDLLNLNITSISKVPEKMQDASSSVFVVSNEDIRRSGATSIPEALRMVPGVEVARVDANKWAVSIRGFNSRTSNKLLVMIDGRTIYDQLFSGVLWETQDIVLEDVDRIEIIRGPGGSTWGANAVNGVINIITKHSKDTQGGLLSGGGGSEERAIFVSRYGGEISENTTYRLYGKYNNRDEGFLPQGSDDESFSGQAGFRIDSKINKENRAMFDGRLSGTQNNNLTLGQNLDGGEGYILGKWENYLSKTSKVTLQSFFDRTEIDTFFLGEERETFEIDLQHYVIPDDSYDFVYGATYRNTADQIRSSELITLEPLNRSMQLASVFAATHIDIIKDKLLLELGTKLEYNEFTSLEVQPNVGMTWNINDSNILWGKISQAVRTPSRLENDFILKLPNSPTPLEGNSRLDSEKLTAFEMGYRYIPAKTLYLTLATFFNDYDDLVTSEIISMGNKGKGDTQGVEVAATWEPLKWWQFKSAYTYLQMDLEFDEESTPAEVTALENIEGNNPHNQFSLRSIMDLGDQWEFDTAVRYVDNLSLTSPVSSYIVVDARIGWKILSDLDLSVVGQNLFDPRHFEQGGPSATQVQQGVYGKITWTF